LPWPFSSQRTGEVHRAGPYAAFLGNFNFVNISCQKKLGGCQGFLNVRHVFIIAYAQRCAIDGGRVRYFAIEVSINMGLFSAGFFHQLVLLFPPSGQFLCGGFDVFCDAHSFEYVSQEPAKFFMRYISLGIVFFQILGLHTGWP